MSALTDLGNNSGHIIVTRTDGVTVVKAFANSQSGERQAIGHALEAGTLIGNKAARGSITIVDLTSAVGQDVTAITINGVNQIGFNVTVGSTDTTAYATLLKDAINSFTPGSGPDYTAESIDNVVNIIAPAALGSSVNGSAITVSQSGVDIINTTLPIDNGSEADTPYDSVIGFRYLLNSTLGSGPTDIGGALEISKNIIMRGLQSTYDTQTITIPAGGVFMSFERTMVSMNILMSAGAPETIDTIDTGDFSIGDQILLSNATGGSAVTINESGNVVLANSSDFVSGDPELVLALKLTDVSGVIKWTEIFRAPNIEISVAAMRAVGIAQPANGSTNITMLAGGQVVPIPVEGIDPGYITVTGSPALTGAFVMNTPAGTPLGRDRFIVDYEATPTDAGGSVTIYGKIFTDNEIIEGGTRVEAWFETNSSTWVISKTAKSDAQQYIETGNISDGAVTTDQLGALAVTNAKIGLLAVDNAQLAASAVTPNKANTAMKRGMVTYPISWEASGLGTNITTEIGGKGTTVKLIVSVTLLVEATNDGTVTVFNTTGGSTIGVVTVPAGTARGTAVVSTVFTVPTFDDGDIITISTAKVTAGGEATLTIVYDAAE